MAVVASLATDGTKPAGASMLPAVTSVVASNHQIIIVGVVALVACGIGLLALVGRNLTSPSDPVAARGSSRTTWNNEVSRICAEGRSVVELTAAKTPGEPGSGLSLSQLGEIETRLDLLIAQLHDVEAGAPSLLLAQSLRMASVQADNLKDLAHTERRLRLTSVNPRTALVDATALQLSKARTSLDDALRVVSQSINELE